VTRRKILLLPGANRSPQFWQPVAKRLPDQWDKVLHVVPGGDHSLASNQAESVATSLLGI
jgi:hypothetical protein